jgi:hypothetical protein
VQQFLLNNALKPVVVVNILRHPVDRVFKSANVDLIRLDLDTCLLDHLLHQFLSSAQIIHSVAEFRVVAVEIAQILIHPVGVLLQVQDFLLTRRNVFLELLNLVVKHVFELFQLLRFLLQLVDLLFSLADVMVFLG